MVDEARSDLQYYSRIRIVGGFDVQGVASCGEAVDCLQREKFDVVLVGQEGPEFVGGPLLAQATQTDSMISLLVLARFLDWDSVLHVMRLGAVGCHLKSMSPSKFAEVDINAIRSRPAEARVS